MRHIYISTLGKNSKTNLKTIHKRHIYKCTNGLFMLNNVFHSFRQNHVFLQGGNDSYN